MICNWDSQSWGNGCKRVLMDGEAIARGYTPME
jgi:hypothetical protein